MATRRRARRPRRGGRRCSPSTRAAGRSVRIARRRHAARLGQPGRARTPSCSTAGLDAIVEHSAATSPRSSAPACTLDDAQAAFAAHGQMLALDPPDARDGATIGGLVATADSGPLRHRYGAPRDLVIGVTVALPDGTVAKAGGKVIKNVAGYDLAKLNAGAFGTLGVIAEVAVRLHPLPEATATARLRARRPRRARPRSRPSSRTARSSSRRSTSATRTASGAILARFAGATCAEQAARARAAARSSRTTRRCGTSSAPASAATLVVRVAGLPTELARRPARRRRGRRERRRPRRRRARSTVARRRAPTRSRGCARRSHRAVRRARRARRRPRARSTRGTSPRAASSTLARRVKERFDPTRVCNPGLFVGGI